MLRQRVTTDIATKGGQFDVLTIGTYEVPIWAKQNWLVPIDNLGADYDVDDLLPPIRDAAVGRRQALCPAVLRRKLDDHVSHRSVREGRAQDAGRADLGFRHRRRRQAHRQVERASTASACAARPAGARTWRFSPPWSNAYGARWFDEKWQPEFNGPEWKKTLDFYVDMMKEAGPPGASSNGFNENLALFNARQMRHVDRRHGRGLVRHQPEGVQGRRQGRLRARAEHRPRQERQLALGLESRHPGGSKKVDAAENFVAWATSKEYIAPGRHEGRLGYRAAWHAHVALPESRLSEGRAVRRAHARVDRTRPIRTIRRSSPCPMSACSSPPSRSSRASAPRSVSNSRRRSPAQPVDAGARGGAVRDRARDDARQSYPKK